MHGVPHFAISIALEREGVIVAGIIYNPVLEDLYYAEKGHGAFLNNKRLRVAGRKELSLLPVRHRPALSGPRRPRPRHGRDRRGTGGLVRHPPLWRRLAGHGLCRRRPL